jgi:hypothetical protein
MGLPEPTIARLLIETCWTGNNGEPVVPGEMLRDLVPHPDGEGE